MASILMLGLENDLVNDLARVLKQDGHITTIAESVADAVRARGVDAVFAGGDGPDYREIVMRMAIARPGLPIVLVNRHPDNSRWLDALELGAADYCGAPFEPVQIRWLLNSVLRSPAPAAA